LAVVAIAGNDKAEIQILTAAPTEKRIGFATALNGKQPQYRIGMCQI
tara:strand:+ start:442 stop:582 length:141 start_codon:yes stop_codon:yes gene_type:complete